MFAKRHYEAIAGVLRRARQRQQFNDSVPEALDDLEQDLTELFQQDNSNFSSFRFTLTAALPHPPAPNCANC
jgi:hypothetical protein